MKKINKKNDDNENNIAMGMSLGMCIGIGAGTAFGAAFNNIPIGMGFNGLLVVVDNENGQVKLEAYESGSFEVICDSLAELILNLS